MSDDTQIPFKYVGEEKYVEIYETKQAKCSSCGLSVPKEVRVERVAVTFLEITNGQPNKLLFKASLNGHKILDKLVEEPCRWTFQ